MLRINQGNGKRRHTQIDGRIALAHIANVQRNAGLLVIVALRWTSSASPPPETTPTTLYPRMKGQEMADSKNIDDGGPAFPCEGGTDSGLYAAPGMSLRDWFAGQALAGIYACRDLQLATLHDQAKPGTGDFDACMAKQAYSQADAMIAARKAGA